MPKSCKCAERQHHFGSQQEALRKEAATVTALLEVSRVQKEATPFYDSGLPELWDRTKGVDNIVKPETLGSEMPRLPAHMHAIACSAQAYQNRELVTKFMEKVQSHRSSVTMPQRMSCSRAAGGQGQRDAGMCQGDTCYKLSTRLRPEQDRQW